MSLPKILHDNRLADAAPVASDTAAGEFDVANLADWLPFTWWKPASMPATVTVDCLAASPVDYWMVWGHDLGSRGATIELRKSSDGFSADDILVDSFAPADDAPFARYVATADERWWRLRLTGASAPSLAIAAIGQALEMPDGLPQGFDPLAREPKGRVNRSVSGNALGATIDHELYEQELAFERVSWSWLRASFLPAWRAHLRNTPFVFSWDPASHPDELRLVVANGGPRTPHYSGSRADLRFKVAGVVD